MEFYFDKVAPFYDFITKTFFLLAGGEKKYREKIAKTYKIKKHNKVLDLGCGTCSLFYYLKKNTKFNFYYFGCDLSRAMLKKAKEKNFLNINLLQSGGDSLPFKDHSFNFLYTFLFLHEIPYKIRKDTLQEIKRVLHPEGKFIIFEFNQPQTFAGKIFNILPRLIEDKTYFEMLRHKLEKELKKAKFTIYKKQLLWFENFVILVCA